MDKKIKSSSKIGNVLDPFLFDFEILTFENRKTNLRLGDIWMLIVVTSQQYFVKFYILGMEEMFGVGDKVIRSFWNSIQVDELEIRCRYCWILEHVNNIDFAMVLDVDSDFFTLFL